MNCASAELLLEAAFDGELDVTQQLQVQEHLETCASCKTTYAGLQQLHEDIRAHAEYYRAPDSLRSKVQAQIPRRAQLPWKWMALAASILLVFSLSANLLLSRRGTPETQLIAQEVLSDHVRSLLTNHQMDVISTDRHTVKPWFADKLDFSPDVKDLTPQGFPLVGGRVDYINRRPVAALVFHRAKHVINLFIWPAGATTDASQSQNGYHVISWTKEGMTYWAVSDVNQDDLHQFTSLYQH
jgi:anti-sigma factor RsiW